MDSNEPAPKNPEIAQRTWTRKKNANGTEIEVEKRNVARFMHWNILADKLTQNFDRVPNKFLDWQYRWKMMK